MKDGRKTKFVIYFKIKFVIYFAIVLVCLRVAGEGSSIILPNYALKKLLSVETLFNVETITRFISLSILVLMFLRPKWIVGSILYLLAVLLKLILYSFSTHLLQITGLTEITFLRLVSALVIIFASSSGMMFYTFLRENKFGEKGIAFWLVRKLGSP